MIRSEAYYRKLDKLKILESNTISSSLLVNVLFIAAYSPNQVIQTLSTITPLDQQVAVQEYTEAPATISSLSSNAEYHISLSDFNFNHEALQLFVRQKNHLPINYSLI